MGKLSFLSGIAVGYVLGARAGRERYEQIRAGAMQLWRSDPVQGQIDNAKHAAKTKAAPAALGVVSNAAAVAGDKLREGADRIKSDPARDVASETVPDIEPDTHTDDPIDDWRDDGGAIYGESQVPRG
ncbi:protoporphyrinogen oxidase [Janibacter sp. GXQ6167]|uniref:protoporphyrinogen oxidase n=1 Tax=Janibacter sp. GXQ6167 TaxID=3240791 RepID=UPI0035261159